VQAPVPLGVRAPIGATVPAGRRPALLTRRDINTTAVVSVDTVADRLLSALNSTDARRQEQHHP